MTSPLRLFAADYALIVLQDDVLYMIRLSPADVARRSERILKGEAAKAVLGDSAHAVPVRELWRLEGALVGKDLLVQWGEHRSFEVDFPDRKSRDAALEGVADALGVLPAVGPMPRSLTAYVPWVGFVLIGLVSGWLYLADGRRSSLALIGLGGAGLLRLLHDFLHPPRRWGVARIQK